MQCGRAPGNSAYSVSFTTQKKSTCSKEHAFNVLYKYFEQIAHKAPSWLSFFFACFFLPLGSLVLKNQLQAFDKDKQILGNTCILATSVSALRVTLLCLQIIFQLYTLYFSQFYSPTVPHNHRLGSVSPPLYKLKGCLWNPLACCELQFSVSCCIWLNGCGFVNCSVWLRDVTQK